MRHVVLCGLLLLLKTGALAADGFSLSVLPGGTLVVRGADGEHVADLPNPTIERHLTVGGESFVASFGHGTDGNLQVMLSPGASHAGSLHFQVLGRHVDAEPGAILTLTFSEDASHVTIDPVIEGGVSVDGRPLRTSRRFAESHETPATARPPVPASTPVSPTTPLVAKTSAPATGVPVLSASAAAEMATPPAKKSEQVKPAEPKVAKHSTPAKPTPAPVPPVKPAAVAATPAKAEIPTKVETATKPATPKVAAKSAPEKTATPAPPAPEKPAAVVATASTPTAPSASSSTPSPALGAPASTPPVADVSAALPLPGTKSAPGATTDNEVPSPGAIANPTGVAPDNGSDVGFAPAAPAPEAPLPPLPKLALNVPKEYGRVLPEMSNGEKNPLYAPAIYVKKIVFAGNTVFDSDTLAGLVTKYTGRTITTAELETATQTITVYYVSHGYINSGALLPDQTPKDGVIKLQVVEGKLTKVVVTGNHWFQTWWLRNQIRQAAGEPFNFNDLKLGVQNLRENPTISQVNAELQPGGAPGESTLNVAVKDTMPFRMSIEVNNYRPPSVGSTIILAHFTDLNLTGNNDTLALSYGIATLEKNTFYFDQLENWSANYTFPISPWKTTMEVGADRNNAGIQEAPFNELQIESKLQEYHVAIHQAVISSPTQSLVLTLQADERRNESSLFGIPFSLSPGAINGVEQVFVPRFIQEYAQKTQDHVLSFRSQFSLGLNAFNSTVNPGPPDGHFFSWLGQAQFIQRLGDSDNTFIFRTSGQLADRPLLSLEQSQLGGIASVRGYLENQALRDNTFLASAEFHLPLLVDKDHNSIIALAPFTDFGLGWNNVVAYGTDPTGSALSGDQSVAMPSVGCGLLVDPWKYLHAQIYWGYGLNRRQVPDGPSLQNQGVEFSVTGSPF